MAFFELVGVHVTGTAVKRTHLPESPVTCGASVNTLASDDLPPGSKLNVPDRQHVRGFKLSRAPDGSSHSNHTSATHDFGSGSSQDVPKMHTATNPKHLSGTETLKDSIDTCSNDELNLDATQDAPRTSRAITKRKNPINNVASKRFKRYEFGAILSSPST